MRRVRMVGLVLALLLVATFAESRQWEEEDFRNRRPHPYRFVPPDRAPGEKVQTVIGEIGHYAPTSGDTFYDIARYYDLGHNEIVAANPGIDQWLPDQQGEDITLPTAWILPCCQYEGLIINIPEMRLYHYQAPTKTDPASVVTHPVGLGRVQWRTPQGDFHITEKTVDPRWVIPESIRQERIADKGFSEHQIEGGAPDNPLGKYRMRLSLPLYAIHGTNIPWGVGMSVSHGCIRMYPEDVEPLFAAVRVGTRGTFVYQTVKIGEREGRIFIEVHDDLYGLQPGRWRLALDQLGSLGLLEEIDEERLHAAITEAQGIPVDITRAGPRPSHKFSGRFWPLTTQAIEDDDDYPAGHTPSRIR